MAHVMPCHDPSCGHPVHMKSQSNSQSEVDKIFDEWRGGMMTHGFSAPSSAIAIDEEARAKLLQLALSCKPEKVDVGSQDIPDATYNRGLGRNAAIDTMEQNILRKFQ